jgi:uncharacterized protein with ParB-like and HNH nuclease domain
MEKKTSTRISTEVELISTLISGINKGEIKIPKFQRKFVWKDDQALDLLDSLANNYPVGSLLLGVRRRNSWLSETSESSAFRQPTTWNQLTTCLMGSND